MSVVTYVFQKNRFIEYPQHMYKSRTEKIFFDCARLSRDPKSMIVMPSKSDSDVMFCLQSYQGLIIERSLVY